MSHFKDDIAVTDCLTGFNGTLPTDWDTGPEQCGISGTSASYVTVLMSVGGGAGKAFLL